MATRRLSGMATSSSVPDNGGDHSGGGGEPEGTYTDDVFSTDLYTGNEQARSIVNGIDLAGNGGMVWRKQRTGTSSHYISDTENQLKSALVSNSTDELAKGGDSFVLGFDEDGYSLGPDSSNYGTNRIGGEYVSWTWRKAPKFFDVVTYTGDGVKNRAVAHNLGCTPGMVITKCVDENRGWYIWHNGAQSAWTGNTTAGDITGGNETGVLGFDSGPLYPDQGPYTYVNDTAFGLDFTLRDVNMPGVEYVAYVFAHDETDSGQIQCGSFSHVNGTPDTIDLGWEPQFLLIKSTSATDNWYMVDTMRGWTDSTDNPTLWAEDNKAEGNQSMGEPTATGFLWPSTQNTNDYIYMAIRKPNKPRPPVGYYVDDVFSTDLYTGNEQARSIVNGIDLAGNGGMVWRKQRTGTSSHYISDTENQLKSALVSNSTDELAKGGDSFVLGFDEDGYSLGPDSSNYGTNRIGGEYVSWTWRKAPKFFDVVTYTGDGVKNRAVAHNLGCTPGMVITKCVDENRGWYIWHNGAQSAWTGNTTAGDITGGNETGVLGFDSGPLYPDQGPYTYVNDTAFGLDFTLRDVNMPGVEYVAYVFAHDETDSGQIQCGSFSHVNGTPDTIDLGWEPQFLLIKSTSATDNWYMVDTMRGWTDSTDNPTLWAEDNKAEGNQSMGEPTATGFLWPSTQNTNDYIYMAIRKPNKPRPPVGYYVDDVFSTYLYKGFPQGLGRNTIENGINLADEGGMVWIKGRTDATDHVLMDSERGPSNVLYSNSEALSASTSWDTTFDSSGFSFFTASGYVNEVNKDYTSWTFRKAPYFFDTVTYTGTGVAKDIPHNLGVEPGMILVKRTDSTQNWWVYHRGSNGANPELGYLVLNSTSSTAPSGLLWNNTKPTNSVFTIDSSANVDQAEYVAYLFAHDDSDESMIKCGTYNGQGHVELGFEPQWLLIKPTDMSYNWVVMDNMRGLPAEGAYSDQLNPNVSDAEKAGMGITIDATGFHNTTFGNKFAYMAIRRPNKPAEEFDPEELFAMDTRASSGGTLAEFISGFPVDMYLRYLKSATFEKRAHTRLLGNTKLITNTDQEEVEDTRVSFSSNVGAGPSGEDVNPDVFAHMFRRAPGFFDTVSWKGAGQGTIRGKRHQLGAVPELMIFKERTLNGASTHWNVYHKALNAPPNNGSANSCLFLNLDSAVTATNTWSNTDPTATEFTVGRDYEWDSLGQKYIAYLFASVPGICDIGSYTGTGFDQDIDCGFTNGARFVLIKRTDVKGHWMVFDTFRGITDGASPSFLLDDNAREQGGSSVKPFSKGFKVVTTSGLTTTNGAEYIYMAIA